jgi:hypothetical protein
MREEYAQTLIKDWLLYTDTGKTYPKDWKPMASFPYGAHPGFFAMVISPGVFSSLKK